jgi:hypothetical protein
MGQLYDIAILGATFLGFGIALKSENGVVIESGGIFGPEFIGNYKVCPPVKVNPKTDAGTEFLRQLEMRKIISASGDIFPAPAVYAMSVFLREKPVDILLMTEVIDIERKDGVYHIKVYHTKGFETITAKKIADTNTFAKKTDAAFTGGIKKSLNAVIYNPGANSLEGLSYNGASKLYTYSLPAPPEKTRYEAIEDLCGLEGVFKNRNMRISSIAPEFAYDIRPIHRVIEEDFVWNPSIAYTNLAEAFDEGALLAEAHQKGNDHDPA